MSLIAMGKWLIISAKCLGLKGVTSFGAYSLSSRRGLGDFRVMNLIIYPRKYRCYCGGYKQVSGYNNMSDTTNINIASNERFVRWQSVLREHVTFLNSLLLTLAIGMLGFTFSLLNTEKFLPTCCQKIFLTSGLFILFFSILFGIATSFSRLFDFRVTLKKIRSELKSDFKNLDDSKYWMNLYSKITWTLFYL